MIDWKHEYDMLARAYKRLLYETARRKYNLSHYTRTQIDINMKAELSTAR